MATLRIRKLKKGEPLGPPFPASDVHFVYINLPVFRSSVETLRATSGFLALAVTTRRMPTATGVAPTSASRRMCA